MLVSFSDSNVFGELDSSISSIEKVKIIAIHGWGRTRSDLLKSLKGLPVLSIDLPGHGSSPKPQMPLGARELAKLINSCLEEKDLSDVIVVGHSLGGRVGICLAAEYPNRIKAFVGTGVPLIRKKVKPSLKYRVIKKLNKLNIISNKKLELMRNKTGSQQYRHTSGVIREMFVKLVNESYEAELLELKCPVRFIWGENDSEATLAQARESIGLIESDATLEVIPERGHNLCKEIDEKLVGAVNEFLV